MTEHILPAVLRVVQAPPRNKSQHQQHIGRLAVSRRVGEAIIIGSDICVRVTRLSDDQVQLTISAPISVSVNREEVAIRIANGEPRPQVNGGAR